jgi:hypothetical protein
MAQVAYTAPAQPTAVVVPANYLLCPGPSGGMADAADSKSAEGNLVRVRLSPRALFLQHLTVFTTDAQSEFKRAGAARSHRGNSAGSHWTDLTVEDWTLVG